MQEAVFIASRVSECVKVHALAIHVGTLDLVIDGAIIIIDQPSAELSVNVKCSFCDAIPAVSFVCQSSQWEDATKDIMQTVLDFKKHEFWNCDNGCFLMYRKCYGQPPPQKRLQCSCSNAECCALLSTCGIENHELYSLSKDDQYYSIRDQLFEALTTIPPMESCERWCEYTGLNNQMTMALCKVVKNHELCGERLDEFLVSAVMESLLFTNDEKCVF